LKRERRASGPERDDEINMKKHQNSLEKPINLRPQTTDHLPNPPKRNTPVYIVTQKKGKEREREREREKERALA